MKGIFLDGCVSGLDYVTDTHEGVLDSQGRFEYEENETITFSIGNLVLGSVLAKVYITPLDFVAESVGRHVTVSHYQVVNTARFLIGLGQIGEAEQKAVEQARYAVNFVQETESFEKDPAITGIFESVGKELAGAAAAKNIVRRCSFGICDFFWRMRG